MFSCLREAVLSVWSNQF